MRPLLPETAARCRAEWELWLVEYLRNHEPGPEMVEAAWNASWLTCRRRPRTDEELAAARAAALAREDQP